MPGTVTAPKGAQAGIRRRCGGGGGGAAVCKHCKIATCKSWEGREEGEGATAQWSLIVVIFAKDEKIIFPDSYSHVVC